MSAAACKIIIDEAGAIVGVAVAAAAQPSAQALGWMPTVSEIIGLSLCLHGTAPLADGIAGGAALSLERARKWETTSADARAVLESWDDHGVPMRSNDEGEEHRVALERFISETHSLIDELQEQIPLGSA